MKKVEKYQDVNVQEQFYKSLRGGETRNHSKKSNQDEGTYMSKNRKKKIGNMKNNRGLLNTDLLDLSDDGDRGKSLGSHLESKSFTNDL